MIPKYIREVSLEVGYDCGAINRFESEEQWLDSVQEVLGAEGVTQDDVDKLETWLGTLTPVQRMTIACGEQEDIARLEALCPKGGPDDTPLTGLFDDLL